MTEMVDLKRTKADKKKDRDGIKAIGPGGDDYGYGTRIHLGPEEMDKLGMSSLPQVGDGVQVHAHGHVTSVSEDHREGGKKHRRVEIQLKHMGVKHGGKEVGRAGGKHADMADGAKAAMDTALAPTDNDEDD